MNLFRPDEKPMTGWEAFKVVLLVLFWGAVIVIGLMAAQNLEASWGG